MFTPILPLRFFTLAFLLAAIPSAVPSQTATKAIVPTAPSLFSRKDLTNFYTWLVDHKHRIRTGLHGRGSD